VNLQIVFACLEKVGDLNLCFLSFLMPNYLVSDVRWNLDGGFLAASVTGQARGHCPYLYNFRSCRGCAPVPALNLEDRRNSFHV